MSITRFNLVLLITLASTLIACGEDADRICKDLAGTWTGKITGTANAFYADTPLVGDVELKITAGDDADSYTLQSMKVEAWSPQVPEAKVPLNVVGEHSFPCDELTVDAPIVAQGLPGKGTLRGSCRDEECSGSFTGKTDNELMDAKGKFTIRRRK